jgi:hypothetical protein
MAHHSPVGVLLHAPPPPPLPKEALERRGNSSLAHGQQHGGWTRAAVIRWLPATRARRRRACPLAATAEQGDPDSLLPRRWEVAACRSCWRWVLATARAPARGSLVSVAS